MISTIERLHRLPFDLIPLIVCQFPKSDENYKLLTDISKGFTTFSRSLAKILTSHSTYGPWIRDHFTIKYTTLIGSIHYHLNGQLHREYDQPAITWSGGTKVWYQYDKLHRDGDQPAVIRGDGLQEWWFRGEQIK